MDIDERMGVSMFTPLELQEFQKGKMLSHRFTLEEAEKAVRIAGGEIEGEDPIKVVIVP